MKYANIYALTKLITKYLRLFILIFTLLVLALMSSALFSFFDTNTLEKELKALKAEKRVNLDEREERERQLIKNYTDTLRLKDLKIDSLDVELSKKDVQIIKIDSDVKLLKGDSLAILDALDRVLSR